MIKFSQLTFQYPQSSQPVLKDVNFEVQPGTLTLVTGASGSGKSTLLRCINGLVPHFSGGVIIGDIRVFGSDPIKQGPQPLASLVGFVFQEPEAQFVFNIVEDEIAFALENAGIPREEMHARVDQVVEQLHLSEIRGKEIHNTSGGEKQMVAIASALVSRPRVLILDEPTSQLDPISADQVLQYIVSLKSDMNLTVLISEHRLERLLPYTDNIAHLTNEHRLVFGPPQEILAKMAQVPPIIEIAKGLGLSPLPLTPQDFPQTSKIKSSHNKDMGYRQTSEQKKPLLEVIDLAVSLSGRSILKDLNLFLSQGEILSLLGANGAGKTTLLRSILGLIPYQGDIRLFNKDMKQMGLSAIIQHIGYLPQNPNDLLFAESVLDELKITLSNHGLEIENEALTTFLNKFGLSEKQNRYPRDLSVGERQRTALAAITVHHPQIIFLDEPTRGMDYQAKHDLSLLLKEWRNQGKAILLVTHDVEFAAGLADRVNIIEDGKISFNGSPQKAFTQFPAFRTQTAQLFPHTNWITAKDISYASLSSNIKSNTSQTRKS